MRRALTGGYGLQYNKLVVDPQRWYQSIPGFWGIADVTHYRTLDRWPRSTIWVSWLNDVTLYCDDYTTLCFSWGWEYTDYAYIPQYYWEKSIDNGLTWEAVTQTPHNLSHTTMRIGHDINVNDSRYQVHGYIDDVRVSIGTGRYLTNFTTPPEQTTDGQTKLILRFAGDHNSGIFYDTSGSNITVNRYSNYSNWWWWNGSVNSAYGATISTMEKKYGTGSLYLLYDGNVVDYITATDAQLAPGTNDFCVEMWFYLDSYNVNYEQIQYGWGTYQLTSPLYDSRDSTNPSAPTGFLLHIKNTGEPEVVFNNRVILRGPKVVTAQWNHIAVRRIQNDWCLYLNGIQVSCYNGLFECASLTNLKVGTLDALYRCRIKIGLREYVTRNASVLVRGATIIFNQNLPFTITGSPGSYVDLSISAYVQESPGRPLAYQWEVNIDSTNPATPWTTLPGRTNPSLSVGPITADNINQAYRVKVTCGVVVAYSNAVVFSVAGF